MERCGACWRDVDARPARLGGIERRMRPAQRRARARRRAQVTCKPPRSWTTFAAQKISVALHYAAAFEISMALRVPKFDQAELDAAAARRMAGGG